MVRCYHHAVGELEVTCDLASLAVQEDSGHPYSCYWAAWKSGASAA